jgi:hypothetical protein
MPAADRERVRVALADADLACLSNRRLAAHLAVPLHAVKAVRPPQRPGELRLARNGVRHGRKGDGPRRCPAGPAAGNGHAAGPGPLPGQAELPIMAEARPPASPFRVLDEFEAVERALAGLAAGWPAEDVASFWQMVQLQARHQLRRLQFAVTRGSSDGGDEASPAQVQRRQHDRGPGPQGGDEADRRDL